MRRNEWWTVLREMAQAQAIAKIQQGEWDNTEKGRLVKRLIGQKRGWCKWPVWAMHKWVGQGRYANANMHIWGTAPIFGHDRVSSAPVRCPLCDKKGSMGTSHYLGLQARASGWQKMSRSVMWVEMRKALEEVYEEVREGIPDWMTGRAEAGTDGEVVEGLEKMGIMDEEVAAAFLGAWPMGQARAMRWGEGVMATILERTNEYLRDMHTSMQAALSDDNRPMRPTTMQSIRQKQEGSLRRESSERWPASSLPPLLPP